MRGKSQPPPREHRPYGDPFALTSLELDRYPMTYAREQKDPEAAVQVAKLKDSDVEVRRAAILALWRLKGEASPATFEAVLESIYDEDWKVRWDAALVLHRLGTLDFLSADPYIARLAARLRNNETSADEKVILTEALGRIGVPAQPYVRSVGGSLEHEDWRVRFAACEAIGRLGPSQHWFKAALVRLKRDEEKLVREAAEKTLRLKPYQEPGWLKVQNPSWRVRVLKSVANNGKGKRQR